MSKAMMHHLSRWIYGCTLRGHLVHPSLHLRSLNRKRDHIVIAQPQTLIIFIVDKLQLRIIHHQNYFLPSLEYRAL